LSDQKSVPGRGAATTRCNTARTEKPVGLRTMLSPVVSLSAQNQQRQILVEHENRPFGVEAMLRRV
jgi:hypothetical protein